MLQTIRAAKKRSSGAKAAGFTIIEVMIVIAVAGLIMGIVFLAVPALQRNARTSQRNADAQLILAAVNECLTNKNNIISSCSSNTDIDAFLDRGKLRALTEATTVAQVTTTGQTTARTAAGDAIDDTWRVSYNTKCNEAGDSGIVVTNQREYAIMYGVENSAGKTVVRCLQG